MIQKTGLIIVNIFLFLGIQNLLLPESTILAANTSGTISITDYGAIGDGGTLCTAAIQQAVDAAAKNRGGKVVFPTGTWLSGTIELKSHVTLHLEQGCILLASPNLKDYPEKIPTIRSYTDNYTRRSLIYAEDKEHIAIEGEGTIDGNGGSFPKKAPYHLRPYLLRVIGCRDVRVKDVFLTSSAMWTQHYLECERLRVNGVRVWGFVNHNNDGIDIDGCKDVILSNCFFSTSDDAITLKSTSNSITQGVVIDNCVVKSRSSAIKFGTESIGGFRDVTISNCSVRPVPGNEPRIFKEREGLCGIELIIVDGGDMQRITLNNITVEGYEVPMCVRLGDRGRGYVNHSNIVDTKSLKKRPVGTIRDISLANIVATGGGKNVGILLLGHPGHPLQDISLSNIFVRNQGGCEAAVANRQVPERAHEYPQAAWWGELPGYGLYARHVRGLRLSGLRLETALPDKRHALVLDDVENCELDGVACLSGVPNNALMRFSNSRDILVRGSKPRSTEGTFLKIVGENSSGITLIGNDLSQVKQIVELASDVHSKHVQMSGNTTPSYLPGDTGDEL